MEKIIALTHQQREEILRQLTAAQVEALGEFTRYAMLSRFHTRHYLNQTDWQFEGMVVDPWYRRSHDHRGENLYCDCGRRLKNQFILRSRSTGRRLFLGISHFQQHASIPAKVAREIQQGINEINLYMDSILLEYRAGQRFPGQLFQEVVDQQGFKHRESTLLYQRCNLFKEVDLPLHQQDMAELRALYQQVQAGQRQRLTKAEIREILVDIVDDWRQIDQQISSFNYDLRQMGIGVQALHRIKSNAVNYALQRRKSRFFVSEYKQLLGLTLTKARSQVAIKLRQLSFYLQLMTTVPTARIKCMQAQQTLLAHQVKLTKSHFFGLEEAKRLLNN